jgi:hypothetical protein
MLHIEGSETQGKMSVVISLVTRSGQGCYRLMLNINISIQGTFENILEILRKCWAYTIAQNSKGVPSHIFTNEFEVYNLVFKLIKDDFI